MKIKISKNKSAYFNFSGKPTNTTLIIILSGISGGKDSDLVKKSVTFFKKNNADILSLNFCKDDIFSKPDCLKTKDLRIDSYLRSLYEGIMIQGKTYKKIIFIGHSFSAVISILFYKKYNKVFNIKNLILWDPSVLSQISNSVKSNFIFDKKNKIYKIKYKKTNLEFSEMFVDDLIKNNDSIKDLDKLKVNIDLFGAEKGAKENAIYYFNEMHKKATLKIISNTGHMFGNYKAKKELFNLTENIITQVTI